MLYEAVQPKIVMGNTIAQAFQFVDTGNAEIGFVALSQLTGNAGGSRWMVPQDLYSEIRQDAVLLKSGADNEAAETFLTFLRGPEGTRGDREIRLRARPKVCVMNLNVSGEVWQPVRLTLELASLTTVILLIVGTPIAWWLARSRSWWKEGVAAFVAMPLADGLVSSLAKAVGLISRPGLLPRS